MPSHKSPTTRIQNGLSPSGSLELAIEVEKELGLRNNFHNWMTRHPSRQSLCLSFSPLGSTMLLCGWFCHWGLKPKEKAMGKILMHTLFIFWIPLPCDMDNGSF